MSDKTKVLCKYHMSGVCRFGAECAFSHDLTDLPNLVCKYYLAGCCAYGDRCRYDHKRPGYWKTKSGRVGPGQQHGAPLPLLLQQQPQQPQPRQQGQQHQQQATRGQLRDVLRTAGQEQQQQHPQLLVRLPRSLSGNSAAAGADGRGGGTSRRAGDGVTVPDSWEDAAAELGEGSSERPCPAGGGAQHGDAGDGYDEYDEENGMDYEYDHGAYYEGYGQQHGYGYYEGGEYSGGGRGGVYDDGGGGDGEEASCTGAGAGGLTMVDDDLGLLHEQQLVAVAATGARPPLLQVGGVDGHSLWAAAQHPRELAAAQGGGGIGGRGTAAPADPVDPADVDLCPGFSLHGQCAEREECELIHGLKCEICHKFRIHPYNAEAAEEHRSSCRLRHERLEARLRSAQVECGICLEPVLTKPCVTERRFGLLTSCDHAFCLACIRSWRGRTDDTTLATDTAVRTCPICRTPSHFVTPSLVWPASSEEKAGIVSAYKDRLASIDCKHFNFGEGTCPFSTSCFYRHMYKDGRLEEPVLRRAGNADGDVRFVMPLRLSAFLDTPQAQRLLSRRL